MNTSSDGSDCACMHENHVRAETHALDRNQDLKVARDYGFEWWEDWSMSEVSVGWGSRLWVMLLNVKTTIRLRALN
jgi:hypothetical protein